MRYTINLDCKTHHVSKDGTFPILLRVSLNGEQDYFNIGKRIKDSHYDRAEKSIKKNINESNKYERLINIHKVRIGDIIDELNKKGEIVSISRLKEIYNLETNGRKSKCFYDFITQRIEWEKKHTSFKSNTFKFIESNFKQLKGFRKKLSYYDINHDFIEEYKFYLKNDLGLQYNTIYHALCFLRKYSKQLFKLGLISKYPFENYSVGSPQEVELVYLEPEELKSLHDLYESRKLLMITKPKSSKFARDFEIGQKYQDVLRYFLVACYTGFRHSDIRTLRKENIIGNNIVKNLVKSKVEKVVRVKIPIQENFFSLLNKDNPYGLIFDNPVMENSQTNKYLKQIMKIACIKKHITFHKARYTFAINSLILGIDIVVISEILGHSLLTTTQRYAKVVDKIRNKEMGKWKGFRQNNTTEIELNCSNCNRSLLKTDPGVLSQNYLTCICPNCNITTRFDLKINEPVLENICHAQGYQ